MRLSAKGRYAIAAMTYIGRKGKDACVPVINISESLDISKIYLEQVFSLLKRGALVRSVKGAQGGYQLNRDPNDITMMDILASIELGLFEKTKATVDKSASEIDQAMTSMVFNPLDQAVSDMLSSVSLKEMIEAATVDDEGYMYFI